MREPPTRVVGEGGEDPAGHLTAYVVGAGDLDGDGDADFVVTGQSTALYRNDGHLSFSRQLIYDGRLLLMKPVDLDGDGRADLAGVSTTGSMATVELLHNEGQGTFSRRKLAEGPGLPEAGVASDFDGDGAPDLLVTWRTPPGPGAIVAVHAITHLGTTPIDQLVFVDSSSNTGTLAAGDLDRDGRVDLVISRELPRDPSRLNRYEQRILWNEAGSMVADENPQPMLGWLPVVADVDGDGALDLAGGSWLLHNAGNRRFDAIPLSEPGPFPDPSPMEAADLDSDGDLDLVVRRDAELVLFRQDGPLHFTEGRWPIPGHPYFMFGFDFPIDLRFAVTDADGDGRPDVLLSDTGYRVHLVSADALAQAMAAPWTPLTVPSSSFPQGLAAADLDGDGDQDLIGIGGGGVRLLANSGGGAFSEVRTLSLSGSAGVYTAFAVADLDGDGKLDVAAANDDSVAAVFLNQGTLSYTQGTRYDISLSAAPPVVDLAAADLDGDGHPDLVAGHSDTSGKTGLLSVMWNDGQGHFAVPGTLLPQPSGVRAIAVADLDGDGRPEVVSVREAALETFRVRPDRTLGQLTSGAAGPNSALRAVAIGDLDRDGAPDVVTGDLYAGRPITVHWNDGKGNLQRTASYRAGWWIDRLAVGDADGDGWPDILGAGTKTGDVSVLVNDGHGGFFPGPWQQAHDPVGLALADLDGRCGPDLAIVNRGDFTIRLQFAGRSP